MRKIILFLIVIIRFSLSQEIRYTKYVDPFIGTDGHGHTYPGATVPFGMVQLSPDAGIVGWDWCSGYHYSDTSVIGFSHTHLSGTGCADLGDISLMPTTSYRNLDPSYRSPTSRKTQKAAPGYYQTLLLDHNILVELTSTTRSGFHRYTFPKSDSARVIVNLSYGQEDVTLDSYIQIIDSVTIAGYRFSKGWALNQKIFFAAKFSSPITKYYFDDRFTERKGESTIAQSRDLRGVFFFPKLLNRQLLVKVGISATGIEGALKNLTEEIPGWDFEKVRHSATALWEKELSKVRIETKVNDRKKIFYTALYHTMLAPVIYNDVDKKYRGADDKIHSASFTNYTIFSLWDTYRSAHPLYTILNPDRVNDFIQSMLAFYKESGQLPIWSLMGNETGTMIGYHSVPVIVDAYLKGFRGYDTIAAFEAIKNSALSTDRGLMYYNLDVRKSLIEKERELINPTMKIVGTISKSDFPRINHFQSGYDCSISGNEMVYPSINSDISQTLITRAHQEDSIEWQTAPVHIDSNEHSVSFVWIAGLATSKKTEKFHLFIDDKKAVSFGVITDTTKKDWTVSENGISLSYKCILFDQWSDTRGYMILTFPRSMATEGIPLRLKVVGNNDNSRQFYMTYKYSLDERTTFKNEFGSVDDSINSGQLVKMSITNLGNDGRLQIKTEGMKIQERTIRFGVNTFLIPIKKVESEKYISISVQRDSFLPKIFPLVIKPDNGIGYIPADKENESVSKTLEYAFDDWCIAQMAKATANEEDYQVFMKRSFFYKNLFDSTTGFMRGKTLEGNWVEPFNPVYGTQRQPEYTEGNAWQYSWSVQHDPAGLIQLHGGKERFGKKLDELFSMKVNLEGTGNPADITGLIGLYAHGNEPSHHIAYLYNYADESEKAQAKIHTILKSFYTNSPNGLIGNEDCGQMSAWYVFSSLGFYPLNPASGKYDIGTPLFDKATIKLENGKEFTIRAKNLSDERFLIDTISLNGKLFGSLFISHNDIVKGGILEFSMKGTHEKQRKR